MHGRLGKGSVHTCCSERPSTCLSPMATIRSPTAIEPHWDAGPPARSSLTKHSLGRAKPKNPPRLASWSLSTMPTPRNPLRGVSALSLSRSSLLCVLGPAGIGRDEGLLSVRTCILGVVFCVRRSCALPAHCRDVKKGPFFGTSIGTKIVFQCSGHV